MFRDFDCPYTDNIQYGVAKGLALHIYAAKESLYVNKNPFLWMLTSGAGVNRKIPIAAISALQTPLLHPAEWRNFQQVPKLSFFSPHFAL